MSSVSRRFGERNGSSLLQRSKYDDGSGCCNIERLSGAIQRDRDGTIASVHERRVEAMSLVAYANHRIAQVCRPIIISSSDNGGNNRPATEFEELVDGQSHHWQAEDRPC
jgi:hypothetical protein